MDYKEEKEKIIEELLQSGKIQAGRVINYAYFQELYKPYVKQMSEQEFANTLEISSVNYRSIKNKRQGTRVLKSKINRITEEEKQEIVENLLQSGKIQVGQLIDYAYFQELYKPHTNQMLEKDFASLLNISYSNFMDIKVLGTRARVLKKQINEMSEEEKQEIIKELLQSEKIQVEQLIDYSYFQELYKPYAKQMPEQGFAALLGISYCNFKNIKNKRNKGKNIKKSNK